MPKLSKDYSVGNLHPRETVFLIGNLATVNAELIIPCDGSASVMLDLRGTFSLTHEVSGTIDGTNWTLIVMRPINQAAKKYVATIAGAVAGLWVGNCAGFRQVKTRVTAFTSGSCVTTIAASNVLPDDAKEALITSDMVTNTGAASAAVTLTLAAPGAGLRHYLTYLAINRFASALLTAGATPVLVTTTNLPGAMAFSVPADAAAQGTMDRYREDYSYPIAAVAQNTATTIVAPITTGVIWRLTAGFYVAP
jgi:hypothetical protein